MFLFKGFSLLYEKYVSCPVRVSCMIFAEITFCPSTNLKQPVIVLVLFLYVSAKLRNALVIIENPGPHFVQRLFFLINISLNVIYLVMYLYMLCILDVNVMY